MKTTSSPCSRHPCGGFTLLELVVVIAIAVLIFAMATPYTLSAIQAASLTAAGDSLVQKISLAQQRAVTENHPVGVDLYFYVKDGMKACHAMQLISYDPATGETKTLEPPAFWSEGRAVLLDGTLSPMFTSTQSPSDAGEVKTQPFTDLEATYKRILFYPNGTTNLHVPLRNAYVTLVSIRNFQEDLTTPPPNYYTVQVDPVTGRTRSYRP